MSITYEKYKFSTRWLMILFIKKKKKCLKIAFTIYICFIRKKYILRSQILFSNSSKQNMLYFA